MSAMEVTMELNGVELSALEFVKEHGPVRLGPIAEHLFSGLTDPAARLKAGRVLDILVRCGLLSRSSVNLHLHGGRGVGGLWEARP